jgi:short-subunit dehydrogenase
LQGKIKAMNKVAVITGATRGIGKALSCAFAQEGFDLALCAGTSDDLMHLKQELEKGHRGINILVKPTDLSDKKSVEGFGAAVVDRFGIPDVLVNNAGIYIPGTIESEPADVMDLQMRINFYANWYLTRVFMEGFKKKKSGHIFNISSFVSKAPRAQAASYSISKAAQYAFNTILVEELRDHHVKVTAILPGSVNTSSWDGIEAPKNTFVQPEDIASAVLTAYRSSPGANTEEIILRPLDRNF